MTVDEAREQRKALEDKIEAAIRDFERQTTLPVVAVHITRAGEVGRRHGAFMRATAEIQLP